MRKEKHKVKSANTYNFGSRYQWKLWDIFIGLANFQYQRTEISQNLKARYFILQIDKFWHQVNSQRFQDYYVRTMALIGKEETRTGVHMSRGIWRSQHTLYHKPNEPKQPCLWFPLSVVLRAGDPVTIQEGAVIAFPITASPQTTVMSQPTSNYKGAVEKSAQGG